MSDESLFVIAELHGAFRGDLVKLVKTWESRLNLALILASVGSSGWWPHCVAFWRITPDALVAQLNDGFHDGFDEGRVWFGESTLYRLARGGLPGGAGAFLLERVTSDGVDLQNLDGPDAVFSQVFAPNQGFAVWGAGDFDALGARQVAGIGSADQVRDCYGWWATVPPEREMV